MTYTITKDFHFSASHELTGLREGHPCSRMHGHNYVVTVHIVHHELNAVGFVVDYGDLKPFSQWIDATLDHRHLNGVLPFMNPTAENLARFLVDALRSQVPSIPEGATVSVGVSETPKTFAWWEE
jgi:6-pyruvoyltetrahydropterin/6-carboxytetrahydropterin synthase